MSFKAPIQTVGRFLRERGAQGLLRADGLEARGPVRSGRRRSQLLWRDQSNSFWGNLLFWENTLLGTDFLGNWTALNSMKSAQKWREMSAFR